MIQLRPCAKKSRHMYPHHFLCDPMTFKYLTISTITNRCWINIHLLHLVVQYRYRSHCGEKNSTS